MTSHDDQKTVDIVNKVYCLYESKDSKHYKFIRAKGYY